MSAASRKDERSQSFDLMKAVLMGPDGFRGLIPALTYIARLYGTDPAEAEAFIGLLERWAEETV
ncbi:hypothetical protein [Nocardia callitridis]|uniref:hypothetical protein n=1 Tax=Nocardia callitridis TaxID=648753 RepID=UPI0031E869E9